jgi:hypothetical protein
VQRHVERQKARGAFAHGPQVAEIERQVRGSAASEDGPAPGPAGSRRDTTFELTRRAHSTRSGLPAKNVPSLLAHPPLESVATAAWVRARTPRPRSSGGRRASKTPARGSIRATRTA